MQRLEVSGAVRPIYGSLGFKRLREVYRMRVVESRGRKTILGPKGNEVRANCNKFESWRFRGDWIRLNILGADCWVKKWNVENIHSLTQLSGGQHCTVTHFLMICIRHQVFGYSNQEWWVRQAMWHAWGEQKCMQGFGEGTWWKDTNWKPLAYGNNIKMEL